LFNVKIFYVGTARLYATLTRLNIEQNERPSHAHSRISCGAFLDEIIRRATRWFYGLSFLSKKSSFFRQNEEQEAYDCIPISGGFSKRLSYK
jgi:hypothetical protein